MAATAERRVVLNADDYGFTAGVNTGILECVAAGVVTSVSVLVNTPGFGDGIRRLGDLGRPFGVGLHLNLTNGPPVSDAREVPTLVGPRGRFRPLPALAARALLGAIDPADVGRESSAQLSRLRAAWPAVDHLDSHRHAHALPGVASAVLGAARAAGVTRIRRPVEPVGSHRGALKRLALATLSRAAIGARTSGDRHPAVVLGLGLDGSRGFLEDLLRVLDRVRPGLTEVVLHPGHAEPELAAWDPYCEERDAELTALLSEPLRRRLSRGDLVLTDFRRA